MTFSVRAEELFEDLQRMPAMEREKFFLLLSASAFRDGDMSHEELFGHLAGSDFTAEEASEYLEVSMLTFRRHVASGKLQPSAKLGRNQLFAVADLKRLKKALQLAKA